jgi:hypothetical protein
MKFITALLAVSLVACLKPLPAPPPQVDMINVPCPDVAKTEYEVVTEESACDKNKVANAIIGVCCNDVACTNAGYRYDIHIMCAQSIIWENRCNSNELQHILLNVSLACDCPVQDPNAIP